MKKYSFLFYFYKQNVYNIKIVSSFLLRGSIDIRRRSLFTYLDKQHASDIHRTTRININRININLNDYYNPVMDYYNPVIDYYNPVIDYYNLLLRFEPCLNLLGLILILCKINLINININPT